MRPFARLLACLLATLGADAQGAERHTLEVRVIRVADGDTVTVKDANGTELKVRLAGIDAPERRQPFSDRSRDSLSRWVRDRTVHLSWSRTDRYGRLLAVVRVDADGPCASPPCTTAPVDVNLAQLASGMAWHYKPYEKQQAAAERRAYALAEQQARGTRQGLWADDHPVPPWEWRKGPVGGPVKKSRRGICHAPAMPDYASVQRFTRYATLEDCLASAGRLPRNGNGR